MWSSHSSACLSSSSFVWVSSFDRSSSFSLSRCDRNRTTNTTTRCCFRWNLRNCSEIGRGVSARASFASMLKKPLHSSPFDFSEVLKGARPWRKSRTLSQLLPKLLDPSAFAALKAMSTPAAVPFVRSSVFLGSERRISLPDLEISARVLDRNVRTHRLSMALVLEKHQLHTYELKRCNPKRSNLPVLAFANPAKNKDAMSMLEFADVSLEPPLSPATVLTRAEKFANVSSRLVKLSPELEADVAASAAGMALVEADNNAFKARMASELLLIAELVDGRCCGRLFRLVTKHIKKRIECRTDAK